MSKSTTVNFVAKGNLPDEWRMVLVEEGPWHGQIDDQLRRIQGRMYGCIDAALDGQLAEDFPESKGRRVVIQLDCYNVPRDEVEGFFSRFSEGVFELEDYRHALESNAFVKDIEFEINFDNIH
ncbi:MAG: hypothetical protein RBS88_07585 [Spongiibacteraceae bacterium]|jgi:hypothetical protein|nr:hypothetical protein [Spongiibacteraceae bacterium]